MLAGAGQGDGAARTPRTCVPAVSGLCSSHLPSLPHPCMQPPTPGTDPNPGGGALGCGCRFLGTDPQCQGPPAVGVMPGAVVPRCSTALPAPRQRPGSFFVLTKQLLFGVKPPGSVSVCSPNSAALPGAGKGCLQKLLLPRNLPACGQESGTGAIWSSPTPVPNAGLSRFSQCGRDEHRVPGGGGGGRRGEGGCSSEEHATCSEDAQGSRMLRDGS